MEKMYLIDAKHLIDMVAATGAVLKEVGIFVKSHDPADFSENIAKDIGHIIYAANEMRNQSVEAMKMLAKQGHPLMKDTFEYARSKGVLHPEDDYEG